MENTFSSNGGEQNIGQGDYAIGKQTITKQDVAGAGNIFSGTGNVHVEHHYYSAPPTAIIPRQLPSLEASFLHREEELAWLNDMLHPGKVVAICGPGGMGKSALAAKAVHQIEPVRFPDGIVFHSFYHQPSTDMVLQTICAAFQVEAKAGLASTVRQVLSGRKALLILDGAEEADDLPAVLALRSTCGVLITTRRRADAPGARLDLKPLDEQPAAEVFRLYSGVATDDASVAGICNLLGGWPVALRIAGRYLSTTGESAADYLAWIEEEPFKELASGEHQEENAALLLRRSVAQVSDNARLALGVAGTLAFAPIAREPLAAILEDDERRARIALGELVNYGLLEKQEERWVISHALIHTYARTELSLSTDALERLSGWYITFCRAQSKAGLQGYAHLDGERAHCLRLVEGCLNSRLWQNVQALAGSIYIYLDRQGYWTEEIAVIGMTLTAARQCGNRQDEAWCLNTLGYICEKRGDYVASLDYLEQSLSIRREIGDRVGEGTTLNNIGWVYHGQGMYKQALEYLEQSLSISRKVGNRQEEGTTLNNIGIIYYEQGRYGKALMYLEESLPINREAGDKIGEGRTLDNIATIYRARGNHTKALEYHDQGLAICRELGDRVREAIICWNMGLTYEDREDFATAEKYMIQAIQIAEFIGYLKLEEWRDGLMDVRAARQD